MDDRFGRARKQDSLNSDDETRSPEHGAEQDDDCPPTLSAPIPIPQVTDSQLNYSIAPRVGIEDPDSNVSLDRPYGWTENQQFARAFSVDLIRVTAQI
jgi:hypothetical protein